ncbi:hypothetical protein BDB01DRAFT_802028 [Pilobolus umbonatus]|nr:hypothetical protein BDB01DRAFT_802028 [Pilobolus umbonatus]
MSTKKPKNNLTWKINLLAAQLGEKTHMKHAQLAANKHRKSGVEDELMAELTNARKEKLNTKLFQAVKELRTILKKAKSTELLKQIKKLKEARQSLEDESSKKKATAEDVVKYEKELEMLKTLDLDKLANKTIKNKLTKQLKKEPLIIELAGSIDTESTNDGLQLDLEARLLSHKIVIEETGKMINEFKHILTVNQEKLEKRAEEQAKRLLEQEKKKRKAEEKEKKEAKKLKMSSEFVQLGEDEDFKKIYEGEKKPNRVGQRTRRKQWEDLYGKEAKHVAEKFNQREEKRAAAGIPKKQPKKEVKKASTVDTSEPVHPSWEAKRIQEEIMSKALSGKLSMNNKIVFE